MARILSVERLELLRSRRDRHRRRSLGLDFEKIGASANLEASVAYTTTKGESVTAQYECPAGLWKCSLKVTPKVRVVSGVCTRTQSHPCVGGPTVTKNDYTVELPVLSQNFAVTTVELCVCQNALHWADAGHPGNSLSRWLLRRGGGGQEGMGPGLMRAVD